MVKLVQGIVHGKTIELAEDLGIADGQQVQIEVKSLSQTKTWGGGIIRWAGGWTAYPEMDAIMEEIYQDRKREHRTQELE